MSIEEESNLGSKVGLLETTVEKMKEGFEKSITAVSKSLENTKLNVFKKVFKLAKKEAKKEAKIEAKKKEEENFNPSAEGWIIFREKIVEYAFEVILICSYFFPEWAIIIPLCLILGFKLFGAYLGKLFNHITQSKDRLLMDKDKIIDVGKNAINKQAHRIYYLEAQLIQEGYKIEQLNDGYDKGRPLTKEEEEG